MQGANALRIKRRKKPLSRNAWAPAWAELCEVLLGNYGLEPITSARQPASMNAATPVAARDPSEAGRLRVTF